MNVKSFLEKLKGQKSVGRQRYVMLQPDAVYFVSHDEQNSSPYEAIEESWEKALDKVLQTQFTPNETITVVLASHHYQVFQIDKPAVPREEWPEALPFLVKDLISERPTEIVADAQLLPNSNKLQVYVLSKKILDKLLVVVAQNQCELGSIVPEDEIWAQSAGELANFLLLQRSVKGQFKLGAFVEHTPMFQRTMRSVFPPLTGESASELQLDGLALELQRSLDYLSSQVKGISLNQLKICCDDEDQETLVAALNERLSANASLLNESMAPSGSLAVQCAALQTTFSVNLYPEYLKPKKELFSLNTVVASLGATSLMLLLIFALTLWQKMGVDNQLAELNAQTQQLRQQVAEQQSKLEKHKPSSEKMAAVERLKVKVRAQEASLAAISQYDASLQTGYSSMMQSLAKLGRNDISLTDIHVVGTNLDIKGLAISANAVPNWVNQFKLETPLVGRNFDKVSISRNEDDVITFELKTRAEGNGK
ncbi:MSHA biogenesis protein MshI [Vibrio sp. IRLE0018]|uniref:MSHA biogenesis protein MshI n=1 Tax=Vibrio TaxID=662 RepID=UPI0015942D6B|nr:MULTISPECIES: MSHA biogenesis protein MshI [Vibrio]MCF8780457.1 MSHA biogenesis protein MshI [Vibrio floridensis]NVC64129.1 MSHA biogenesis protein MshI [Vibrio sp. 05-20-BW147]